MVRMRRWFLVAAVVSAMLVLVGCGSKAIPKAAIDEIYALSQTDAVSKYAEVKQVDDRKGSTYIMLYIKSAPGKFTSLEDGVTAAKAINLPFLKSAVEVLKKYKIDSDVAVWIQLPLANGGVTILGHAEYDGKAYKDFIPYQS